MKKDRKYSIMKYFEYGHLPEGLQRLSKPFGDLAEELESYYQQEHFNIDENEWYEGLRKLLEAKDCFVRSGVRS